MHTIHSPEFKEQALSKARERGSRTLGSIAKELNLPLGTLKGWLGSANKHTSLSLNGVVGHWNPSQRLLALQESHHLSGPELHAWCREKGLFEHQLNQWREAFCQPDVSRSPASNVALRTLQRSFEQLQRELRRKDKALAEAAAILILQKKFQALLEDEDK